MGCTTVNIAGQIKKICHKEGETGAETPSADAQLMPMLDARAAMSMQRAWDGDNDGSAIQINPGIVVYTA